MNEQMDREAILTAAQKEKRKGKELENREGVRSAAWGGIVSVLLAVVLLLLQYFVKGTVNVGFLAIGMSSAAVQHLFEGFKTRKPLLIVLGIIAACIAILFIAVFISQLFSNVWIA